MMSNPCHCNLGDIFPVPSLLYVLVAQQKYKQSAMILASLYSHRTLCIHPLRAFSSLVLTCTKISGSDQDEGILCLTILSLFILPSDYNHHVFISLFALSIVGCVAEEFLKPKIPHNFDYRCLFHILVFTTAVFRECRKTISAGSGKQFRDYPEFKRGSGCPVRRIIIPPPGIISQNLRPNFPLHPNWHLHHCLLNIEIFLEEWGSQ